MQAILFEHLVQFHRLMAKLAGHQMQMMHLCLPLIPLQAVFGAFVAAVQSASQSDEGAPQSASISTANVPCVSVV